MDAVPDRIAVWAITPGGAALGRRIGDAFPKSRLMVSESVAGSAETAEVFSRLKPAFQNTFHRYDAHICLFSTGIAVRILAPLLVSKLEDPAVVVVDDRGLHAVSLVSGHLGGGNALALAVAETIGADPVITTATDVNRVPAIDVIAKALGLSIQNPEMIRKVNMAFLKGEPVRLFQPTAGLERALPPEYRWRNGQKRSAPVPGAAVMCSDLSGPVPKDTLVLRPPSLTAGMGCNRGTGCDELLALLTGTFEKEGLAMESLAALATTDIKEDEPGLIRLAEKLSVPLQFYTRDALNSVKTIQTPSRIVERHLGVKSVCEAAAILAAHHGPLVIPKIKKGNATLAVARVPADCL